VEEKKLFEERFCCHFAEAKLLPYKDTKAAAAAAASE